MKKVLIFGGSFDPIHNAHLRLCQVAYQTLDIDKCFFLLAKKPRWKTPSCQPIDRLNMLKLALKEYPYFKVSLAEYRSKAEQTYTYDTMKNICKSHLHKYYYLIGSDQLLQLHKWYEIDKLSNLVTFIVFRRKGYPLHQENMIKFHCQLLEYEEIDISSTEIRTLSKINSPKPVLDYIAKHELYYIPLLDRFISKKRKAHSISVASLSYDIAKSNLLDPYKAYQAGLIHDIAKNKTSENEKVLMARDFPSLTEKVGEWAYHQFLGPLIAKNELSITDDEILEAIRYHATGKGNMSPLGKVIYCADKLDPLRGWDSKELIELCKKDINTGFIAVLKANIDYLKTNNKDYSNEFTNECIKHYLKEENN